MITISSQASVEGIAPMHEKRHLVQQLSQTGAHEVPQQFLVPPEQRPHPAQRNTGLLPFVDLANLNGGGDSEADTLKDIAKACEEWGFFQVVNHGIPATVIEGTRQAARQFFELPMVDKEGYNVKDQSTEGLLGYGHTDFFQGAANDWMDSLFGYLAPPSLKKLDMWPSKPEKLRGMVDSYGIEVQNLFKRLLAVMSKNLCMKDDHLEKAFQHYNLFFRANYYPPCPQPDLVLGTHGHKDHGCLTVLLQDKDMDGLQVCKDGQWFSVDPIPNALVINIGDQLQMLTNGKYKSALHRGVVSNNQTIMTLVAHLDPPEKAIIEA